MKKRIFKNVAFVILTALFVQSCSEDGLLKDREKENVIPESFRVDIPESISNDYTTKSGLKSSANSEEGGIDGKDIYGHLANFIAIGEGASQIVEDIMISIALYQINRPMVLSYNSDDDGRLKNMTVTENEDFDGMPWSYKLVITDAESEGNDDGGKGIEVFWNLDPIKGVAILKPYNINRNDLENGQAVFRIDYGETTEYDYDQWMIVSISDLPTPSWEQYAVDNLKMFAGKKGDVVDVYGNSNHPNFSFTDGEHQGFNWAFVASANEVTNLGVAEVGLPYSDADISTRQEILVDNSVYNFFVREVQAVWPGITQEMLAPYLVNTQPPGYFNEEDGFLAAGEAPAEGFSQLEINIQSLVPYNPKQIMELTVEFSE